MMPWLIWHLQIGGIQHFYFGNYSWYSVKYLPIVNRYFWDYGSPGYSNLSQLFDYYSNFFSLFWGQLLIGVSWLFILIGLIKIKSRLRALCIVWIIITIVPLLLIQTATFARYIYFTLPPFIILASYGFYYLIKRLNKKFILAITLLVLILGCLQIQSYFENFLNSSSYPSEDSPSIQDINLFKTIINDNNNIYSRHHAFQYYFQNNRFIVPSDMSEEDSISFLSWKNEADISIIMEKYQIGWIMLYKDESWEKDYYIWVKEVTGDYTKHYINIEDSANFQKVSEGNIYILYKYIEI